VEDRFLLPMEFSKGETMSQTVLHWNEWWITFVPKF